MNWSQIEGKPAQLDAKSRHLKLEWNEGQLDSVIIGHYRLRVAGTGILVERNVEKAGGAWVVHAEGIRRRFETEAEANKFAMDITQVLPGGEIPVVRFVERTTQETRVTKKKKGKR